MTVLSKPQSNGSNNNKVAERIQHHVRSFPPPISFLKSKKAKEKKESSDYREFEMKLDPTDANSQKTKKSALVFENGDPEMWCEWRRQVDDLCRLLGIKETDADYADKLEKILVGLLRGKALENFETYKGKQEAANAARPNASRWIDPANGWFECVAIPDATSYTVMEAFHNAWLCRYPRPRMVRFDNGSEFKSVFVQMCENYHMKHKPTTSYNPQSNGIIERVHLVLRDSLATFELSNEALPEQNPFDSFVAAASWALRSSYHSTLKATPGQLVFGRDMLLDVKFKADWGAIRLRKQALIDKGVERENKSCIHHDYKVGDRVYYELPDIVPKMDVPRTGPFTITQVYTNGNVSIQKGAVNDRVNIRNISPCFE